MKKILQILSFILLGCCLFLAFGIFAPCSQNIDEAKLFSVERGQSLFDIAKNLQEQKLVRSQFYFELAVLFQGGATRLQAGNYSLNPILSPWQIAQDIILGDVAKKSVTIREGWTNNDINDYLKAQGLFSNDEFLRALKKDYSPEFSVLDEEITSLEGYLFPDTYYLKTGEEPESLIEKMLANFDQKLNPDLRAEIDGQGKTIPQIIIMASLLEREISNPADKRVVAGILWKRLELGMYLNVDASIAYALGRKISGSDTKTNSPYNTYLRKGLPPGPICNPGLNSILAAVYPQSSSYLYYLSAPDGQTIFSKTLNEHNQAVIKYLR